MAEKYLELAKKLKALAERGIGGEKYNAQQALDRFLQKHGISIEDLEDDKEENHWIRVGDNKALFTQVAASVLGANTKVCTNFKYQKGKMCIVTTKAKAVEVEAKFNFYSALYKKEVDIFYEAFIVANGIFPMDGVKKDMGELSKEERDRARRAMEMASSIASNPFHKLLEQKR